MKLYHLYSNHLSHQFIYMARLGVPGNSELTDGEAEFDESDTVEMQAFDPSWVEEGATDEPKIDSAPPSNELTDAEIDRLLKEGAEVAREDVGETLVPSTTGGFSILSPEILREGLREYKSKKVGSSQSKDKASEPDLEAANEILK